MVFGSRGVAGYVMSRVSLVLKLAVESVMGHFMEDKIALAILLKLNHVLHRYLTVRLMLWIISGGNGEPALLAAVLALKREVEHVLLHSLVDRNAVHLQKLKAA